MAKKDVFIRCLVRQSMVKALPEEKVRQAFLQYMVQDLGYPMQALSVEVPLSELPHLQNKKGKTPDRRADILVFHPNKEVVRPLLLVECKAVSLTDRVIQQALGYNFYVQAPFVAIVNTDEVHCGQYDIKRGSFLSQAALPAYATIVHQERLLRS